MPQITTSIDDMPAGREMDALVAEKVMGWDHTHDIDHCEGDSWYSHCRNCHRTGEDEEIMCWNPRDPPLPGCKVAPHYSTSIEAAWEVIEKLEKEGIIDGVSLSAIGCELYLNREQLTAADGPAPLAICRAAVKAGGMTDSEQEWVAERTVPSDPSDFFKSLVAGKPVEVSGRKICKAGKWTFHYPWPNL